MFESVNKTEKSITAGLNQKRSYKHEPKDVVPNLPVRYL